MSDAVRYCTLPDAARILGMTIGQLEDHLWRGLADYAPMRSMKVGQQRLWTERQLIAYRDNGLSAWPHLLKAERLYGADALIALVARSTGRPYSYNQLRHSIAQGKLAGFVVGKTRVFSYGEARAWIRKYHNRE